MMLLSPLLWLFILVETKKLFKTRNEIYCPDTPIEKKVKYFKPVIWQSNKLIVLLWLLSQIC